jgi:PIN domain nuclease of toxin-antitoxin system
VILLLDTHALLWWLDDQPKLSQIARSAITDPLNDVLVSAATVWELGIKRALGKLQMTPDVAGAIDRAGFSGLPINLDDATAAAELPRHHDDPFDRMLIAQANRLEAVIVSRDRAFSAYGVHQLLA